MKRYGVVEMQEPQLRKDLLPPSSGLQHGYITLQVHGNKVTEHEKYKS
jgi:hypothetical protein